jgi:hypothetical protein
MVVCEMEQKQQKGGGQEGGGLAQLVGGWGGDVCVYVCVSCGVLQVYVRCVGPWACDGKRKCILRVRGVFVVVAVSLLFSAEQLLAGWILWWLVCLLLACPPSYLCLCLCS